ncbi:pentapeptide repeat-containing protein [Actinomadura sp. 21ATH]|uniref:pentapeptide repeat-containing protein n=1 Tax=Actinomadura sp. 21ATH TaxID=1735444 RepID=UPI0035C006D6
MTRARRRAQYALARPAVRGAGVVLAGVGLLALAAVYAVALWKMPSWMGLEGRGGDAKDRHNARLLVVSAGGAVVVAISLLYTARSYRLSHRGQVTDRFTKALERLSSTDLDARLGGIHALAHVAGDSRPHHDDVVEVLEAFIRRRAPQARPEEDGPTLSRRPPLPERPDSDVQAALTALGRRPPRPERRRVDLSALHLTTARLADLDFNHMDLQRANLGGADLSGADLRGAVLERANLRDADLRGAVLERANLRHADLRGAVLEDADLRHAGLWFADLRGADLRRAGLWFANLRGANLQRAKLRGANLRYADLQQVNLRAADLRFADLRAADLRGATGQPEQDIRALAKVDHRTTFGAVQ